MEEWKDIPGYEGIYQASTEGRIRTVEGKTTRSKKCPTRKWKSRILKGRGDNPKTGKRVNLWKDGKHQDWLVARLVAITFLGYPPDGFTVNHIDGDRMNNSVQNLEWLSLADNIRHGFRTGLYKKSQKPIILCNDLVQLRFDSMAQCDEFLGRATGYTSYAIKKFNAVTDSHGIIYMCKIASE